MRPRHIRKISTGEYYRGDSHKEQWSYNQNDRKVYDLKDDAQSARQEYIEQEGLNKYQGKDIQIIKER